MHHSDWFYIRYELIKKYPKCPFDEGKILEAHHFEGYTTLDVDKSIYPEHFKDHFKKLRWWEHRTIEQLLTIKYAKVVASGNYYLIGDIAEVKEIRYNDKSLVGGRDSLLFSLNGHHFMPSQIEPATQQEYNQFLERNQTFK